MITWAVEKQPDGVFVVWPDDHAEPRFFVRNLAEELKRHGIVDDLYEDVCRQLKKGDKATVDVPRVTIRQL